MKKGLSLGIVILMTALLGACGEETSKEGGGTGNGGSRRGKYGKCMEYIYLF